MGKSYYSVQTFRAKGKRLEADLPVEVGDEEQALRKVERMAVGKAGAVALRLDGDLEFGGGDPVVLKVIGQVPPVFREAPF